MNFLWSSYEVHNKFLRRSHEFHVKLCIYGFIWTSYEWASRSIVISPTTTQARLNTGLSRRKAPAHGSSSVMFVHSYLGTSGRHIRQFASLPSVLCDMEYQSSGWRYDHPSSSPKKYPLDFSWLDKTRGLIRPSRLQNGTQSSQRNTIRPCWPRSDRL